jgi:hypothetical protein
MDDKHLEQMSVPLGHKLKILKRIKEVRVSKGMYVPPSRQGAREPVPKKEAPQVEPNTGSGGVATENQEKQGGSLLDGTYDEEEQQRQFQEALKAWRTGGTKTEEETSKPAAKAEKVLVLLMTRFRKCASQENLRKRSPKLKRNHPHRRKVSSSL